ncbi:MAG: acetolactate synthase, large subunit, biosynthetic type [Sphingobacteriales bacterium 17-39-43]|uniref:biosynthetic-type acetolactate synthase large subunit n=1 Tax=Daejeonella sp. TaxID=2805397 RepID=UPI000BCABBF4|nr:biosynthetic-type acetolactate synthase large subunit [Daejeonella sp.]OYY03463.1 MAG: acetolactate synthase, large subunit, biosynthetic type [Sphingobacteriia bacterium 35-40-5]OYZ29401.1 MAG: acetolactate synthase, large subunit, biosynthetic type [Sphingobacteriales bacterium 16-39-50]OYZ59209.1 MAG: acetolactate synthase, large subunit, biosynthetic type [Sphingobacteriales bacterium 24-40-4]OZA22492.1 MAG: acetolactate synthase, large subunit, biosynthetic type [Sphingobacteriales bact
MEIEQQALSNPTGVETIEVSGSVALLEALIAEGTEVIFGYPGGAIMPIYDALYDYKEKLNHILVRHEQGGIHAGQGFARTSGKVGVVFATSGPGATNLVTGLADAMIDSTPLVCITGQVFAHLLGTDAFQETDVINITTPVTKWNYQITDATEIPEVLSKAFYIARSGRPGPVLIDITKNAQIQKFDYSGYTPCNHIRSYRPKPLIRNEYIEKAAALINQAKKPFVLWGQGVILGEAELEFKAFVEKSGIPSAWTILGAGAIPTDHPLNVGMLGMHGNYGPNVLTNECDVIIAIGMRFDDRVTGRLDKYAKQAKIIHLDIDPSEIDKNVQTTVPVWGDCKETLPALTALIQQKTYPEWLQKFRDFEQKEIEAVINDELHPASGELTMGEVISHLNELTHGEAIIVTDVGQHQMVACRYAKLNKTRSNVTSGGLGTMGFALPAAIGAKFGAPERTVVAVIGDGGFQMTLQELGTIMQSNIDVKILILNNRFLGMVRQWQELFNQHRYSFVDIESPDFVALAAAYRIKGKSISERGEISSSLKEMLEHKGSFLLEVMVTKENNVFPMVPQGCSVSEIRLK